PMGYVRGLPVGLSFVGRPWSEGTLIKFAYAYEQATRVRRPPRLLATVDLGAGRREQRLAAHAGRERGARRHEQREGEKGAGKASGGVLHEAHEIGAHEARRVAERVDQRDAGGGGGAAQEHRRQAPERPERAREPRGREREGERGEDGGAGRGRREREPRGTGRERASHVQGPLPRAIGMRGDDHHGRRGGERRYSRQEPDAEVAQRRPALDELRQP